MFVGQAIATHRDRDSTKVGRIVLTDENHGVHELARSARGEQDRPVMSLLPTGAKTRSRTVPVDVLTEVVIDRPAGEVAAYGAGLETFPRKPEVVSGNRHRPTVVN